MTSADRWLLPDGVEEVLPQEAGRLETLRRRILDVYTTWGYELVITPMIEYLDSLLVGSSHDLDLHTFKLTDQLSGRLMGARADITPQVARIDAHNLDREGPARFCYSDTVLHTRPRGLHTSRTPIRIGAELFGHAGIECDVEIICLMMKTLETAEIDGIHLILGHVGLFRNLVREAGLDRDQEQVLFDAMQRKAYSEIEKLLDSYRVSTDLRAMLSGLSRLSGGEDVLEQAETVFADAPESVSTELDFLSRTADMVRKRLPGITLGFDLCELRGYAYHTGMVFAAYTPEYGRAVAKGGRFDDIGRVFGRARPASGFDADLKVLARLSRLPAPVAGSILAPAHEDPALERLVAELRASGERVIQALAAEMDDPAVLDEMHCKQLIVHDGQGWTLKNR